MKISDKAYNILKWIALTFIPAATTFLGVLLPAVGVDASVTTVILTILPAVATFLGTLIGVSTIKYQEEEIAQLKAKVGKDEDASV